MNFTRILIILLSSFVILVIPYIAMRFTPEVNWGVWDFVVAGLLLFSAGLSLEYILRKGKNRRYKLFYIFLLLVLFFLIWAELAVGIFGTPFAGT